MLLKADASIGPTTYVSEYVTQSPTNQGARQLTERTFKFRTQLFGHRLFTTDARLGRVYKIIYMNNLIFRAHSICKHQTDSFTL